MQAVLSVELVSEALDVFHWHGHLDFSARGASTAGLLGPSRRRAGPGRRKRCPPVRLTREVHAMAGGAAVCVYLLPYFNRLVCGRSAGARQDRSNRHQHSNAAHRLGKTACDFGDGGAGKDNERSRLWLWKFESSCRSDWIISRPRRNQPRGRHQHIKPLNDRRPLRCRHRRGRYGLHDRREAITRLVLSCRTHAAWQGGRPCPCPCRLPFPPGRQPSRGGFVRPWLSAWGRARRATGPPPP